MFLLGKTRLGEDMLVNARATYDTHLVTQATNKVNGTAAYRAIVIDYNAIIALNISQGCRGGDSTRACYSNVGSRKNHARRNHGQ